jgi:hypothetical protein
MKKEKSNRLIVSVAALLVVAVAAVGLVTTKRLRNRPQKKAQAVSAEDRAGLYGSKLTIPGPSLESGPTAAAEEDYANRSGPAAYVPFDLTRAAQTAWQAAKSQKGKNKQGAWTLAGPSGLDDPAILTFSGAPYRASGRVTALVVDPACSQSKCTVWMAAAGGGVWRTDNALSGNGVSWTLISDSFATNAIGTLTFDAARGTLYAGTGEPNASADSEAGFGIYKSTDRGNTWTHLAANTSVPAGLGVDCDAANGFPPGTFGTRTAPAYSGPAFDGRAIGSVVVDPGNANIMYVASTRAVRGVSSVSSGGAVSLAPGLPPFGLWKSTDGGANFTLLLPQDVCLNPTLAGNAGIVQASFGSTRGVHEAALDPNSSSIIYAAPFPQNNAVPRNTKGGVWRSTDNGTTWTQIKTALDSAQNTDRASFALASIASGFTRMYVGVGNASEAAADLARLYRTDDAAGAASFTDLTAVQDASSAPNQTLGYCGDPNVGAQCWYDNVVYSPPGKPDVVYLGGSFNYQRYGFRNNGRAFLRSADAGVHFTDMTWDATTNPTPPGSCCQPNAIAPNGMHPDSHAMVEIPGTDAAIFGSDGGLVRSSGQFADISLQCDSRPISPLSMATCHQLLSAVPTLLYNLNKGLSTLQFQSLSVASDDPKHLQGGTQDNGTMETTGTAQAWPQIIYGDGGQSGFNPSNSAVRFNSFSGNFHDANFQNADPSKWVIASGPIASGEPNGSQFYAPIIADPAAAGTIFEGSLSVWRTQDWGGSQAFLEANCPEFTTSGANPACGDFVRIGPSGATTLTTSAADYRGTSRAGGNVAAVARGAGDTSTLWVGTTTGRIFVSKNADNATNTAVTFTRIDTLDSNNPARFPSTIFVDPSNPNHAWISYSSYSSLTPTTPGHVFSVIFNPSGPSATWTSLDGTGSTAFPDFPATGLAADSNGDIYVSNDFGVMLLSSGSTDWQLAGTGLPMVEVNGLTIVPSARKLYAATHGRSAWQLTLP